MSEYGHYHKTCMKAVQTKVPARCYGCSKVLVKDASVQCDLDTSYIGKAKSVTFSLGIESRGDTPAKPQLCEYGHYHKTCMKAVRTEVPAR